MLHALLFSYISSVHIHSVNIHESGSSRTPCKSSFQKYPSGASPSINWWRNLSPLLDTKMYYLRYRTPLRVESYNRKAVRCLWSKTEHHSSRFTKSTPDFFTNRQEVSSCSSTQAASNINSADLERRKVDLGEFSSPSTIFFLSCFLLFEFLHVNGKGQKNRLQFGNWFFTCYFFQRNFHTL